MVKKLIKWGALLALLGGGFWLWRQLSSNPPGLVPLPYSIPASKQGLLLEAPVLIVGDRVGARFGLFKENLALGISVGLSKPIKIQSIAKEGHGLHRTLHQLKSLEKWPRVLIYHGGSEEFFESKFITNQIKKVRANFDLYNNDKALTAMMLWPFLSRLIYQPINRVNLPEEPSPKMKTAYSDMEYQERLELTYRLFEIELNELVTMARKNSALLILTTTPINIDVSPQRTCTNAESAAIKKEVKLIRELIKNQDYKGAYAKSQELSSSTIANAQVLYLHGQVAYRNGHRKEAIDSLKKAAAYDCIGWRSNEVTNNIIRKVAQEQRVTLFDFANMVEQDWNKNVTFFDEVYPQDIYYERAMKYLGTVLRKILKI